MNTLLLTSIAFLALGILLRNRRNRAIAKARRQHKRLPR